MAGRVSSLSLVRYRTSDYSVPVAYGHRDVIVRGYVDRVVIVRGYVDRVVIVRGYVDRVVIVRGYVDRVVIVRGYVDRVVIVRGYVDRVVIVRGYVDRVVISCGSEVIARHPRSYERDDFVYDPIHYLPLQERKTGALEQAAPLQGWDLPEEFSTLRRLLESRMGRRGKREYVQVLRLLETFSQEEMAAAAKAAIRLGAISSDAVKPLVLCRPEDRTPRLDPELYPCLPRVRVGTTSAKDYMTLLSGRAA